MSYSRRLGRAAVLFAELGLDYLQMKRPDRDRAIQHLNDSLMLVTALTAEIG